MPCLPPFSMAPQPALQRPVRTLFTSFHSPPPCRSCALMHNETQPTTKELLISWQLIWQRKLNGKPAELKDAIASHATLFSKGNRNEVEARTKRTVAAFSADPKAIRALLNRSQATLRSL